jgi:hypothetical protein
VEAFGEGARSVPSKVNLGGSSSAANQPVAISQLAYTSRHGPTSPAEIRYRTARPPARPLPPLTMTRMRTSQSWGEGNARNTVFVAAACWGEA